MFAFDLYARGKPSTMLSARRIVETAQLCLAFVANANSMPAFKYCNGKYPKTQNQNDLQTLTQSISISIFTKH